MRKQYDLTILNRLKNDGYLTVEQHPEFDLHIWNYSKKAEREKYWITEVCDCRSLVLDGTGRVVSRSFEKFFNVGERPVDAALMRGECQVLPKWDGSLIHIFDYEGTTIIASRGRFTSPQAMEATRIFKERDYDISPFYSYSCEVIYPENRFVVDYGNHRDLVLLAARHRDTDTWEPNLRWSGWTGKIAFPLRILPSPVDFDALSELIKDTEEGFVLFWPETGFRLKLKGAHYLKLFRVLMTTSPKAIWELLRDGADPEFICSSLPLEFHAWVFATAENLYDEYDRTYAEAERVYESIRRQDPQMERRGFVEWVKANPYPHKFLLFLLWDGGDVRSAVWELIKPKGPFPPAFAAVPEEVAA